MKAQHLNKKYFVPTLLSTSIVSSFVWAQEAPTAPAKKGMEEVVVTAQKRAEKLEDVPLSITAITPESLERSGITTIEDIGRLSAGVQVNRAGAFTQPSIRGITTLTLGYGFENNVAVYVDGMYEADMISINTDLANIASVQILKGPQGTLYGRNATGGAIVIETMDPGKEAQGKVQASAGNLNDQRIQAYVSAPLTDTLGFSIAGSTHTNDGYIRDIGNNANSSADDYDIAPLKDRSLRLKLKWTPSDTLAVTLGHNDTYHLDARGYAYRYIAHVNPLLGQGTPPARATKDNTTSLTIIPDNGSRVDETTGKVVWDTGIGTLTSNTGYTERNSHSNFDIDGSKPDGSHSENTQIDQYSFQQSLDFYTNVIDRFDINVGAMYFRDRFHNDYANAFVGNVLQRTQFIEMTTDALAAYFDITWQPIDHLFLTAGYRRSVENKGSHILEVANPAVIPPLAVAPEYDKDKTFSAGTPRLVARYELSPSSNVYASYTEGFRSGAWNPTPQPTVALDVPVDQEKVKAYEIGFKTVTGDVRFSTAAYYYDYTNLQVGLTTVLPTGAPTQTVFNAKSAKSYGAEAQIDYMPINNLNLAASIAYTHARYTDFANGFGTALLATGYNGTRAQDFSDQQMARAPDWTANASVDYTLNNVISGGDLTLAANAAYTDSFVMRNLSLYGPAAPAPYNPNNQRYRQGGFTTVNSQINWTDATQRYTVGVYVQNLTDKKHYLDYSGSAYGDSMQYDYGRTYGAKLGYSF
jgi:iron complex outermembrane recepter protein